MCCVRVRLPLSLSDSSFCNPCCEVVKTKGNDAKFYASHDFAQFGVGISNYFKVNRILH